MGEPHPISSPPIASRLHTILMLVLLVAYAWAVAIEAAKMRAHTGPPLAVLYSRTVIFEWRVVAYVVVGVRRQGGSLRDLVGGKWERARDFWRDVLVATVFWIVSMVCRGGLSFALHLNRGVDAVRFLIPQSRVEITLWILVSLTAGFCEETIFRGYLQRQFIAWLRKPVLGILLSAAAFGALHAYQGARQTIVIGVFGAMFGILAYWRRSLRPGIMVHAWNDATTGLVLRFVVK